MRGKPLKRLFSSETFAQPAKNCQKGLILGAKTTPHVFNAL